MKDTHILLRNINPKQVCEVNVPEQFQYDSIHGAWLSNNGRLLVEDAEFKGVASKKKDIETGEDQK